MVMELVRGDELAAYFDMTQDFHLEFTLEDAVRMTCELLEALGYAHGKGVIHRDVKPANVMLTQDLRVKLTDFGVARLAQTVAALNAGDFEPEMVGTPSFMSPEQITGQAVGPQSDLFAVGIILYQFLTNERPFRGAGLFAIQQKILYEQPVPPTLLNPMLHPDYDRIVNRALAKQPQDRYPDARAFLRDLRRVLNGESIDATLPGGVPREATLPPWTPAPDGDPDATRIKGATPAPDADATVLRPQPRRAS
jgi:serine/threonine-protein kinase